jgi:hypothetical protein
VSLPSSGVHHNPAVVGFASTSGDIPAGAGVKPTSGSFASTSLLTSAERSVVVDEAAQFSAALAASSGVGNTAFMCAIDELDPIVLAALSHVLASERLEVRLASELPVVLEAGSPSAIFERLLPLHVAIDTPLLALWMHTYRAFSSPRELLVNLIDRFAKPLRRFASLPALDSRLSTAQRNAIVARTRSQVLYILDYWLRHYVTDFIDDDRLFAECCAFLAHTRIRSARDRHSGSFAPDTLAAAASAAAAAVDNASLSRSGGEDDADDHNSGESERSSSRRSGNSGSSVGTNGGGGGGGKKHRLPVPAPASRSTSVDERRTAEHRAKMQLLVTLQEEAGAYQRVVRVPRDTLTVELLWCLMQSGDNGLVYEEVAEANGVFVRYATGADIVTWITRLINDDRGSARQLAQDLYGAHLLVPQVPLMPPAPLFSDSDGVTYRVSSESAVPFHRSRPAHETPSKKMLKYTDAADIDPKARTVLDFHPIELARQLALAAHECFVAVRPQELMSRAWMKDSADVHAQKCPNVKRMIEQFNRINRWVASEIVLVIDDAKQRLSVLKRMIELAHCCREVQNLHAMYAIYVGLNMWAVQRLKALWAALPAKWQKRYDELDELANPKSNSAAMRALLRTLDPPIVPPIDLTLRDMTALGELDEFVESPLSPRTASEQPPPLPSADESAAAAPPLPLPPSSDEQFHQFSCDFAEKRLVNMTKKRREADVLRRVRRCQRSSYVFAGHGEIARFLWNARAPFDDVQLTVLSNLCEPSTSSNGPADSESVLASLKATGDVRARVSSRFGGVFQRARTSSVSKVKPTMTTPNSPVIDSVKARGRLASMPVRPQFDVAAMAAAGKEADLKTELLRGQTRFKASALAEGSEKPTSPAPLPPSGGGGGSGGGSAGSAAVQRQRSVNRGSAPPMPAM